MNQENQVKIFEIAIGIIIVFFGTWFVAKFSNNSPSEYETRGCDAGSWCK